jgi:tetratricopeptide (TPR) repeat protein
MQSNELLIKIFKECNDINQKKEYLAEIFNQNNISNEIKSKCICEISKNANGCEKQYIPYLLQVIKSNNKDIMAIKRLAHMYFMTCLRKKQFDCHMMLTKLRDNVKDYSQMAYSCNPMQNDDGYDSKESDDEDNVIPDAIDDRNVTIEGMNYYLDKAVQLGLNNPEMMKMEFYNSLCRLIYNYNTMDDEVNMNKYLQISIDNDIADGMYEYAEICEKNGDTQKQIEYLKMAINTNPEKHRNKDHICWSYRELVKLYQTQDNTEQYEEYFFKMFDYTKSVGKNACNLRYLYRFLTREKNEGFIHHTTLIKVIDRIENDKRIDVQYKQFIHNWMILYRIERNVFGVNIHKQKNDCSICQEKKYDFVTLSCDHSLCTTCFISLEQKVCPYCKKDIYDEGLEFDDNSSIHDCAMSDSDEEFMQ